MIKGIGVDCVELKRFEQRCDEPEFLQQFLTQSEVAHALESQRRVAYAASLYAIKEAVFKALGCGLYHGSYWHDVEVDEDFVIKLSGFLGRDAAGKSVSRIHVSHSRSHNYVVAYVILEGES